MYASFDVPPCIQRCCVLVPFFEALRAVSCTQVAPPSVGHMVPRYPSCLTEVWGGAEGVNHNRGGCLDHRQKVRNASNAYGQRRVFMLPLIQKSIGRSAHAGSNAAYWIEASFPGKWALSLA